MKKKIFAIFTAVTLLTVLVSCNERNLPLEGSTEFADTTVLTEGTVTRTTDPNATYVIPEPINGTYDAYGCTNLFHGDYNIEYSKAVIMKDGKEITRDEIVKGDIIAVYFSGMIAESYPAQPVGVTKIEVVTGEPSEYQCETEKGSCKLFRVTCLAVGIFAEDYEE